MKFRTACLFNGTSTDEEEKKLRLGCEVVVATPGKLLSHIKRKKINFNATLAIVLDEADVLFEDITFPLQKIGKEVPSNVQFVFATATIPFEVEKKIKAEFPNVKVIHGPGLHRTSPLTTVNIVDCSLSEKTRIDDPSVIFNKKTESLLLAMQKTSELRTIIFCNSIFQCRDVENYLNKKSKILSLNGKVTDILCYHGAIRSDVRQKNLRDFCR